MKKELKKTIIRLSIVTLIFIVMLIPIKRNPPAICDCVYTDPHEVYRALLYTYTKRYVVRKDENGEFIQDEIIRKIYIWPFNDWNRIIADLT